MPDRGVIARARAKRDRAIRWAVWTLLVALNDLLRDVPPGPYADKDREPRR